MKTSHKLITVIATFAVATIASADDGKQQPVREYRPAQGGSAQSPQAQREFQIAAQKALEAINAQKAQNPNVTRDAGGAIKTLPRP